MTLFDSHAHYYDDKFKALPGGADALLRTLFDGDVEGIVNISTNNHNALEVLAMAERYPRMYAAVGIHPEDATALSATLAEIERLRAILGTENLRRARKIVALGEIGLDYHWEPLDKEKQMFFFERQMQMADALGLPVIIHDREAHGDVMDVIRRFPRVKGVLHSFSGSAEMAKELCRLGWYISFSGTVTFKNATRLAEVAASVPTERMLVETDCPYLAPHPHRGEVNHSGLMALTVARLAQIKGIDAEEMARVTAENAKRFFNIQ